MTTDEIRERFIDFFKSRGHKIIRSDSLVPENDPTLLFTSAGMNQFKDYFLGLKKDLKRAASSQKCLRTGDLDEVGRTAYHHSFFEMLGNFSFGDYFKTEAIQWAWEFLTKELDLSRERLRVSVHESDDEAYKIWHDEMGVPEKWITRLGDKTNFWPANAPKEGPNGPCGPCSEIYYDQGEEYASKPHRCSIEHDCGRFAEIWNLVFTQFDRQEGGKLVPLKQKNIDTGMGLERLACAIQGKKTNFEIDIFQPINKEIEKIIGVRVQETSRKSLYAVSDHIRAIVFAIADGITPSNEGRGYVIRKLIRRAIWCGWDLAPSKKGADIFLHKLVPVVVRTMSKAYPELIEAQKNIVDSLMTEETNFEETTVRGRKILFQKFEELDRRGKKVLPGEFVFDLHDRLGFRYESTKYIVEKKGFKIEQDEFDRLMQAQRKRAKRASEITGGIFVTSELDKRLHELPATKFLGYDTHQGRGKVLLAQVEQNKGIIVLDRTPFYGESGGQVGDQGILKDQSFEAKVEDTKKKDSYHLHYVQILKGKIHEGMEVEAVIDSKRRDAAMRNHTATHLLHAVLREVLGKQVRQVGSLVHPDRLRFDYSFLRPLTEEELLRIESRVNEEILKDTPLQKEEKDFEEAKSEGALAFFGEKYGDRVRVVTVPGISKEFCGGTHCERTGQIGAFVITSDGSIASGVRRMEALTGTGAIRYTQELRSQLKRAGEKLRAAPSEVVERIEKLQERLKKAERESRERTPAMADPKALIEKGEKVGDYHLIVERFNETSREELRRISDSLRSQTKNTIWLLLGQIQERVHFVIGLSADLKTGSVDARELAREVAGLLKGSGGGRKDFAEGGGSERNAFEAILETLREKLCSL